MQRALCQVSTFTLAGVVCGAGLWAFGLTGCQPANVSAEAADPTAPEKRPAGEKPPARETPPDAKTDTDGPVVDDAFPFPNRVKAPSLEGAGDWINTPRPIDLKDLKGKFVVLDFWTYCCINCMHVLPELAKLEKAYPNNVVVIGVHSAKFETEKDTKNITDAVMRYEIAHPVLNDSKMVVWDKYAASGWPALRIIDPEGYVIAGDGGEIPFEVFDGFFKKAIPIYRKRGTLDETPVHFELAATSAPQTPLRFPGKILADETGNRLFVADSNHNRIVITNLNGKLLDVIGSGVIGEADGDFAAASFDHPQGMILHGDTLYVADTENHLLRKVELAKRRVTTIAGTGKQASTPWPGLDKLRSEEGGDVKLPKRWVGKPKETAINSPWDLLIHGKDLYIAMAGPHQIWRMPLDESEIGPYAGNAREDIVDGPLLPERPFSLGFSSFAQPSGLASDGTWLYVADSEGSSIRAVPFDATKEVKTVVGTAELPGARLFTFGDKDGEDNDVKLQHALGVVHVDGLLYITDSYNDKIKVIDPKRRSSKTIAGGEKPGATDEPAAFDEPAGISYAKGKLYIADTNNHLIRTVDLKNKNRVATVRIDGLKPPAKPVAAQKPSFDGVPVVDAGQVSVSPDKKGAVALQVKLTLPVGWKINPLAPASFYVEAVGDSGPVDRSALGKTVRLAKPDAAFTIPLSVTAAAGEQTLRVLTDYYYCQQDERGLCKTGRVAWTVKLAVGAGKTSIVPLAYEIE
jgi:thiol-disulfide isomerase/thioredoxin/DNA-binding beta-propeller fold protein YncE